MQRIRLGRYVNLGAHAISLLAHITPHTAQRWIDQDMAPAAFVALLQLTIDGDLSMIDGAWSGWRITRGLLHVPDGSAQLTPQAIQARPWLLELARISRACGTDPA